MASSDLEEDSSGIVPPSSKRDNPRIEFRDNHPKLPADKPEGYAHLVVPNECLDAWSHTKDGRSMMLGDGIVTTLYEFKPSVLDLFLDQKNISSFSFWYRPKSSLSFHIGRKDRQMRCGWYDPKGGRWHLQLVYDLPRGGKWRLDWGERGTEWGIGPLGFKSKKAAEEAGIKLARSLVAQKLWDSPEHITVEMTRKDDGTVWSMVPQKPASRRSHGNSPSPTMDMTDAPQDESD